MCPDDDDDGWNCSQSGAGWSHHPPSIGGRHLFAIIRGHSLKSGLIGNDEDDDERNDGRGDDVVDALHGHGDQLKRDPL